VQATNDDDVGWRREVRTIAWRYEEEGQPRSPIGRKRTSATCRRHNELSAHGDIRFSNAAG
jgi:hypothetical protein